MQVPGGEHGPAPPQGVPAGAGLATTQVPLPSHVATFPQVICPGPKALTAAAAQEMPAGANSAVQSPLSWHLPCVQLAAKGERLLTSQDLPTSVAPLQWPELVHTPSLTQLLEHGAPGGLLGLSWQLPSAWQVPWEQGDIEQPHAAPTLATLVHLPCASTALVQHSEGPVGSGREQAGGFGYSGSTHWPWAVHTPAPQSPGPLQAAPTLSFWVQIPSAEHSCA